MQKNKVLLILGMHRSGTSLLTRSAKVFGFQFSDNVMPPAGNIEKLGYWEDLDLYRLNEEILSILGRTWHHPVLITAEEIKILKKNFLFFIQ